MSGSELLPSIGATGKWSLKAPFDSNYVPDLAYSCKAIQKLSQMVATGDQVFEVLYAPHGLSREVYDQHVMDDISIITILSTLGNWIFVPMPYVDGWPSGDVVPYVVLGMVVDLGPIPDTIDPTFLTEKVRNTIFSSLGHEPIITYASLSPVTNKTFEDHTRLENLRLGNITDDNSDYVRRVVAEKNLEEAQTLIQQLQQFIIDSGILPPSP